MENFTISTSQNIDIQQDFASVGERILATLLDGLFVVAYMALISFLGSLLFHSSWVGLLFLPIVFYHLLLELFMNGQSWGKKLVKIQVVDLHGARPGFFRFFLRWIFRLVDVTLFFGAVAILAVLVSKRKQRLGDMAAGTVLIRLRDKKPSDWLYTLLPDDYKINYPEVSQLAMADIQTVKEVLDFVKSSRKSYEAMRLADRTKKMLEAKMGISAGVRSEHFLFKVIRDYYFLQTKNSGR